MSVPSKWMPPPGVFKSSLEMYQMQVEAEKARQAQIDAIVQQEMIRSAVQGLPFVVENSMPNREIIFTVYGVSNGFIAETTTGSVVIGATLSEVCVAAQAKVGEEKLLAGSEEVTMAPKRSEVNRWQKLFKP